MDQLDTKDAPIEKKKARDRGKLIFLGVFILAVILVYITQQSGAALSDWPGDLQAALTKAKKEDRKVLVFFADKRPSTTARNMSTRTLKKNGKHISNRKLITVLLKVDKTGESAQRYRIRTLPTFILLDSEGKELNRRVGFVGEVSFRNDFLDCGKVMP